MLGILQRNGDYPSHEIKTSPERASGRRHAAAMRVLHVNRNSGPPPYALLAYAGALPFIACAVLALSGVARVPHVASVAGIAASYGLLIVAFMAGTHWGIAQRLPGGAPAIILLASNGITLLAWAAFLLAPVRSGLVVLTAAFAVLYLVDRNLHRRGGIEAGYLTVRRNVTLMVVAALSLTILAMPSR